MYFNIILSSQFSTYGNIDAEISPGGSLWPNAVKLEAMFGTLKAQQNSRRLVASLYDTIWRH